MWRRLCVDVDADGRVIGASAEVYTETSSEADHIVVMEPGYGDGLRPSEVCGKLEVEGWLQFPLRPAHRD